MSDTRQKTILVTGGSSQIGEAILRRFEGDHALLTTVSSKESQSQLARQWPGLKSAVCDFKNFNAASDEAVALCPQVDVLVLNACTQLPDYRLFHEHDAAAFFAFVSENLQANLALLQASLVGMKERGYGRIVFVSTMAVEMGMSKYSPYVVAKGALEGLMRNIAVDYGRNNIFANVLRPGIIRTERNAKQLSNPKYELRAGRVIPAGHIGEPKQVAEAAYFLCREDSYTNGHTLNVSGGLPMVGSLLKI